MIFRPVAAALVFGSLLAAPAVAQDGLVELDDDFVVPRLNLPVEALDDYDVVDREGRDLGNFVSVLGPDENTASVMVIAFDGPGFLFDTDVERIVAIEDVFIEGDDMVIDITEEGVRQLPVYQD